MRTRAGRRFPASELGVDLRARLRRRGPRLGCPQRRRAHEQHLGEHRRVACPGGSGNDATHRVGDDRNRTTKFGDERGEVVDNGVEADHVQRHGGAQRTPLVEVHDSVPILEWSERVEEVAVIVSRPPVNDQDRWADAPLPHVEVVAGVADREVPLARVVVAPHIHSIADGRPLNQGCRGGIGQGPLEAEVAIADGVVDPVADELTFLDNTRATGEAAKFGVFRHECG